jgi:hypothetical protein
VYARLEARQNSPPRFFFGRLSDLLVRFSAVGSNSNGWDRWEWAGFFVTTGSMVASGRGGYRLREEDRVSGFSTDYRFRFWVSGVRESEFLKPDT